MVTCLIIFIILGIVCWFSAIITYVKKKSNVINVCAIGALFFLTGLLPLLQFLQDDKKDGMKYLCICLAVMFFYFGLQSVFNSLRCNTIVSALYLQCNRYSGAKGISVYAPVCSYDYEGKHYEVQTPQSFSASYICKKFVGGMPIDIRINPKHPETFIIKKKTEVLLLIVALFFLLGGIFIQ